MLIRAGDEMNAEKKRNAGRRIRNRPTGETLTSGAHSAREESWWKCMQIRENSNVKPFAQTANVATARLTQPAEHTSTAYWLYPGCENTLDAAISIFRDRTIEILEQLAWLC